VAVAVAAVAAAAAAAVAEMVELTLYLNARLVLVYYGTVENGRN